MACGADGTGAAQAGCCPDEGAAVIAADPDAGVSILGFSAVVGIGQSHPDGFESVPESGDKFA
jgi:hypothetical protein